MVMLIDYIYNEICALQALGEHRIKDWIIFKSPWYTIGIVGAYLCIVCVIGPAFMRGRKPYNLNKILIVYNSTQILCSAYITYKCILMGWFWKYKFACEPIDYSTSQHGMAVLEVMWYYFLLKIYDLSDTLFFVLRKKNNQVTFLHLYHHGGMILLTWLAIRTVPGGHGTFLGVVNGFVHVIMYSYYLFASLKFCKIWWKKYVTQLQILQFTLIAIQIVYTNPLKMTDYKEIVAGIRDPIIDSWPLMGSPGPIVFIVSIYLLFVTKIGPKIMENRPAFELKNLLIFYNASLVIFNIWIASVATKIDLSVLIRSKGCKLQYHRLSKDGSLETTLPEAAWWYFFTKIIELIDTVFFILRKKQNQLTFLHIYHHSVTALFSWCYLKLIPGEQGIIIGILNSTVHIIMYSYYLISALGPKYKKYLWWKKYMTTVQLIQFVIMMIYLLFTLVMDCGVPKILTYCFMIHVVIFIYLFSNFYRKAYIRQKKSVK
ncbi:elongation of very long chain fatty acids protein 7-like [Polistes fuscatus]|uniref:elongation of very long chain fatty acids protein 7-like n=1 Tax=Polistes fuscatus TaxID=30207 RepID=UPI001CA9C869|nr:elongation of very long chain fatty acids protein 7-like [Polistes fuscatus]